MRTWLVAAIALIILCIIIQIRYKLITESYPPEVQRYQERVEAQEHPPEVSQMRQALADFKRIGRKPRWDTLVEMGDILVAGAYPRYLPDRDLALRCYRLAAMSPDAKTAGTGQAKYIAARCARMDPGDLGGDPMPTEYAADLCEKAEQTLRDTPGHEFTRPTFGRYDGIARQRPATARVGDFQNPPFIVAREWGQTRERLRNDRAQNQNSHDHSVMSISKKNIQALKGSYRIAPNEVSDDQIMQDIIDSADTMSERQLQDARIVLRSLNHKDIHSSLDISEKRALEIVYDKIQHIEDPVLKRNLMETLGKQLSSAVEHGTTVCSTGRINRIIGTLDTVSTDDIGTKISQLRPITVVREELANLAAKTREDFVARLPIDDAMEYEAGDRKDIEQQMKAEFEKKAQSIYVDELRMSSDVLQPIVNLYSDGF